jgi:hypothetical protein
MGDFSDFGEAYYINNAVWAFSQNTINGEKTLFSYNIFIDENENDWITTIV